MPYPLIVLLLRLANVGALVLAVSCVSAQANVVRSTAAEAELVAAQAALIPGRPADLGLRLKLDPGWHVYWKNAGDSGTPPSLSLRIPEGFKAGELQFAYPQRIPIAHLVNYGYEGEVLFPVRVEVPQESVTGAVIKIDARAEWLECKESCLPASADLTLSVPVAANAGRSAWSALFEQTRSKLPVPLPGSAAVQSSRVANAVQLDIRGLGDCTGADFFPEREGVFVHAKIARMEAANGLRFQLPLEANAIVPASFAGVLTCAGAMNAVSAYRVESPLSVAAAPGFAAGATSTSDSVSLGLALLFALIGGVVLNLMPCVFPVLGLKVLGLSQHANAATSERAVHAMRFLAGVVVSCLALAATMLALRAAGEHIGWGFQLQSAVFVSALAVLFFLLALNLSGYFEFGFGMQSAAGRMNAGLSGPFFDGVLVVLVASPCTAPLMGAAIGYTLSQPAPIVMLVFTALALGIALPYLVLVLKPALLRRLPRSGPWLESMRQFLAFPLYATVLWLVWVLGELVGLSAVIRLATLLLALVFAIWLMRRRSHRLLAVAMACVAVGGALYWLATVERAATQPAHADAVWKPWSVAAVDNYRREGKPVLVDFTAAWCVTCQVNKLTVLNTDAVHEALHSSGTIALRADWTRRDPEISQALAALGRNGVPVYALYAADGRVTLLPEVLTTQIVIEALKRGRQAYAPNDSTTRLGVLQ